LVSPYTIVLVLCATICNGGALLAQDYLPVYLDEDDPAIVDLEDSLDYPDSEPGQVGFDGDFRVGYFSTRRNLYDGSNDNSDDVTARFRYGANFGFTDHARLKVRLATVCSVGSCDPNLDFSATPGNGANINDGDIVVDEFYLDFFQKGRFDLAVGRMQTRSATRGGLFISSLSRMNSPNVAVNWTDGAALRFITDGGWNSKLVAQYNHREGSSSLARDPLEFDDNNSRFSWLYSLESLQRWHMFTQRAFDVTFLPSSLRTEGPQQGRVEDYWNLVGRFAAQWPQESNSSTWVISGELGYAPNTPSQSSIQTGSSGEAGGLAWHLEASLLNLRPGHSIGINYGYAESGWLLSPSYRPNEEAVTLRYHWRPRPRIQLEIQGRWRKELDQLINTQSNLSSFDWRIRLTWILQSRVKSAR